MRRSDDIAGVDGCKGGWVVATLRGVFVTEQLDCASFERVGIDIPIGLSDGSPRVCDMEARRYLGRARSSVFPAPPRAALACTDYRSALDTARSATGRGISKQTFNIMPKVADVDRLIDPHDPDRVIEVHPECTFKMLNNERSLPSKKSEQGQLLRRQLLMEYFDIPRAAPRGAVLDDLFDAYAVLFSVSRFGRGAHRVFGDGERDSRGIEMRIVL